MGELATLTLVELATVVEGFGTALAALFALVGIAMVYVQIRGQRAIQREATAVNLFCQYLQLSMERPELVSPDHDALTRDGGLIRYELFVANMLYSFEEVLLATRAKDWRDVVRGELTRHVAYLRSPAFQSKRDYYDTELIGIIDGICAETPADT